MSDSKYFTTTKKGEIKELKKELDNPKENVKKEAVKKVPQFVAVVDHCISSWIGGLIATPSSIT
jgi:hypothetical protein